MIIKPLFNGLIGAASLLVLYFSAIGLISGWPFAVAQFYQFWYFILALAFGFGIQVGLYTYLKDAVHHNASRGIVAFSGTTSTAAMISCCAHYLVGILPIIGISGAISLISQYQIEIFWFGLAVNTISIIYIVSRIINAQRQ